MIKTTCLFECLAIQLRRFSVESWRFDVEARQGVNRKILAYYVAASPG